MFFTSTRTDFTSLKLVKECLITTRQQQYLSTGPATKERISRNLLCTVILSFQSADEKQNFLQSNKSKEFMADKQPHHV